MAITISGENNNDRILASDGVIDQLSGFNVVGVMTATSFTGDLTGDVTGNVTGNLTGNVNATSNLLLQIGGSEKFRVGSSGQLGIGGANYGSSGQVLTSGGSGSAATWSTIASDKITEGNTEAEVVDTGSDGHFKVTTEGTERLRITSTGSVGIGEDAPVAKVHIAGSNYVSVGGGGFDSNVVLAITRNFATGHSAGLALNSGTNATSFIHLGDADDPDIGKITYDHANNFMSFTSNANERLRIDSSGRVLIGTATEGQATADDLTIATSGTTGITIRSGTGNDGNIYFSDGTSGSDEFRGYIQYGHSSNSLTLGTNSIERLRITAAGNVGIGVNDPDAKLEVLEDIFVKGSSGDGDTGIQIRSGSSALSNQHQIRTGGGNGNMLFLEAVGGTGIIAMKTAGSERLRIGSDGQINIAGILTATTVTQRTSKFYGVTTTDRNALSPSEGDIIYNTTTNKHEFYTASSSWVPISAQAPEFDNASGSLATFYSESRSYVTPTSPTASGDAPLAYSISAGSLPSGMSINSSTGVLSGTPNAVGSDTTSNFTVRVSNTGGAVERDYSITVKAPVTTNYSYTGSTVSWSKPDANVKRVLFRMWGGAGSHGTCTSNNQNPGAGGKTEGLINVTSHNNLYLQVGEAGGNTNSGPNGGWPNGGNGNISHSCKGSGGGGSSNIYHSSGTGSYTYIVAVAGGGGSVSHGNPNSNGGDGGGTNGGSSNRGGSGGTQNAGGSQGSTPCGNTGNSGAGTRLQGGTAGTGSGCTNAGAGGGGGWWGGGAGGNSNSGNTYGGGGGGSGYFDTSLVSGGATKTYGDSGWGDNRPSGIGGRASYGDNNRGGHGYITLIY